MIRPIPLEASPPSPCTHPVSDLSCPKAKRCERCSDLVCDCGAEVDLALTVACPTCRAPQGAECRARRGGRAGGYRPYLGHHVERRMLAAGMCLTCEGAGSVVVYDQHGIADRDGCPSCGSTGRSS